MRRRPLWRTPRTRGPRHFPYTIRRVNTASGELAYFDEGEGPALVFVHGLGGDLTHFEHIAVPLAKHFRVVGVDLPGCGDSCKPDRRLSMDTCARALLDLLGELGIDRATLVGHSAGGMVCAHTALSAPGRFDRLVLINTAGIRGYSAVVRQLARVILRRPLVDGILLFAAYYILAHVFAQDNEFTRKFAEDNIYKPRGARLRHISKVMADLLPELMRAQVAENAHRLDLPALVIWGDQDRLAPLGLVRAAVTRLPRGRLEIVPGAGHMPLIEEPRRTVELLHDFLTGAAPRLGIVA